MRLLDFVNYDPQNDIPTAKAVPARSEYDDLLASIWQRHYEERARRYEISQQHTARMQAVRV